MRAKDSLEIKETQTTSQNLRDNGSWSEFLSLVISGGLIMLATLASTLIEDPTLSLVFANLSLLGLALFVYLIAIKCLHATIDFLSVLSDFIERFKNKKR